MLPLITRLEDIFLNKRMLEKVYIFCNPNHKLLTRINIYTLYRRGLGGLQGNRFVL